MTPLLLVLNIVVLSYLGKWIVVRKHKISATTASYEAGGKVADLPKQCAITACVKGDKSPLYLSLSTRWSLMLSLRLRSFYLTEKNPPVDIRQEFLWASEIVRTLWLPHRIHSVPTTDCY
jgi:hypothetical protein